MALGSGFRLASCAALIALAAACAAPAPRTVTPTAAAAAFVGGDVIAITVIDPAPLAAAELIAGDGTSYAAGDITTSVVAPADGGLQPQVGLAGSGGPRSGSDIGVGVMLPMFSWGGAKGILRSRATVAVPDMAAYRATWRLWQIRARLGRPGSAGAGYVSIPAPPPPG